MGHSSTEDPTSDDNTFLFILVYQKAVVSTVALSVGKNFRDRLKRCLHKNIMRDMQVQI